MSTQKPRESGYSKSAKKHGRKYLYIFHFINPVSFTFLAGNLITLLLTRLNASNTIIGITSSFLYISFFFLPLGKRSVRKLGLIKTFTRNWTFRYLAFLPALLAPMAAAASPKLAIALIIAAYLGFQIFRGIGIVSFSPVMNELSSGKDRGEFLSKSQIVVHTAAILAGLCVVFFLGEKAPLSRYSMFFLFGILFGISGAFSFSKIKEPVNREGASEKNFLSSLKKTFAQKKYRNFFIAFAVFLFASNFSRPFLIVYAKKLYFLGDNKIFLLTLFGSIGAIIMSMINKTTMDRIGFKPMIILSVFIFIIGTIIPVFVPVLAGPYHWVILGIIFLVCYMGGTGTETNSQAYFFHIAEPGELVNLGILYFMVMGISGALGSFSGGGILDIIQKQTGAYTHSVFQIFFLISAVLSLGALFLMLFIERQGAATVKEAISSIFSPRDWKAMILLNKLEKSSNAHDERKVLRNIKSTASMLALEDVEKRLTSVSFSVRREALYTIQHLPWTEITEKRLIEIVTRYPFSSAHHAARLLGRKGSQKSVPVLQEALESKDYLLKANAALALAELGNIDSISRISALVTESENTRVIIYAIAALSQFDDSDSVLTLLKKYHSQHLPDILKNEIIFAFAHFWGADSNFYQAYTEYLESKAEIKKLNEIQIKQVAGPEEAGDYILKNRNILDNPLVFLIRYIIDPEQL